MYFDASPDHFAVKAVSFGVLWMHGDCPRTEDREEDGADVLDPNGTEEWHG